MSQKECKEISSSQSERYYMRLLNLPWSASQQDIKTFFKDIQIPEGGISIYKRDVFIAFLSSHDLTEALKKNGYNLQGAKIYLFSVEKSDLYRLRHRNVRRTLFFSRRTLRGGFTLRRIRPTSQTSDSMDMFRVFNPKENEQEVLLKHEVLLKQVARGITEETTAKRKIKPTQVAGISKYENYHFEDKYSFETSQCSKKRKLDENFFEMLPLCKT